ncbi:MAG: fumarylacetoacetate hydrolase family protein [Actinomycetota bacterium]|nr:fumarylacetoacetate hydrolase family protein [Actinomycetota bacterium]
MQGSRAPVSGLGTATIGDRTAVVVARGDHVLDLDRHAADLGLAPGFSTRDLLDEWDARLPIVRDLAATAQGWLPVREVTVRAPIEPRQLLQAGANYRTHVIDLHVAHAAVLDDATGAPAPDATASRAEAARLMDERAATGEPYLFVGLPSAITGPYDDVALPAGTESADWELELVAVIGRETFRVTADEAPDHVAAYTIANDLTIRDLVFRNDMPRIGTDWFRSKNAPGFLPLGPWLVPADEVGDPADLRMTLALNGEVMQDESTKDMVFDVAALVAAASRTARLLPGDLLLTGSPAGNGMHHGRLLREGDVMEGSITRLGTQRTRVVAEQATQPQHTTRTAT